MFFAATAIYAHVELYYELNWWRYLDNREEKKVEQEPVKQVKEKKKQGPFKKSASKRNGAKTKDE